MDQHLTSLQAGTIIGGRYEVVKCLGAGSMGLVYACRHTELSGHMVAVKVLFPDVAEDEVSAARFRNEVFAMYGVSHPNVVRAYEYINEGEMIAYSMEFVGGGDLADRLEADELIPIPETVRILIEMCQGVQAIHNSGIVHRDLKPENILLSKEGQVKITDFGIARLESGPRLTEHGGVVGTIDYVSPEYMLKSEVDNRSDIYAIGILAYEMVAGDSPFKGSSVYQTMSLRLKSDPNPPSTLRPECPAALDAIVLKAMARDPQTRYQSATEMSAALLALQPDDQKRSGTFQAIAPPPEPVKLAPAAPAAVDAPTMITPQPTSSEFEEVVIASLYQVANGTTAEPPAEAIDYQQMTVMVSRPSTAEIEAAGQRGDEPEVAPRASGAIVQESVAPEQPKMVVEATSPKGDKPIYDGVTSGAFGQLAPENERSRANPPSPSTDSSNKIKIVGLAVGILLILVVGALIVLRSMG